MASSLSQTNADVTALLLSGFANNMLAYGNSNDPVKPAIGDASLPNSIVIDSPKSTWLKEIEDIVANKTKIETPMSSIIEKRAERLIVIRRKKMKKHKLKKLRRKMKFEWAKVRQRREMRKEKAFQATLLTQIKTAEAFSAEKYVSQILQKANDTPLPRFWKGRRLPAFIIKEKLGIK